MKHPFEIFATVLKATGISKERLQGNQRTSEVVRARVLYSTIAREAGHSYPEIGRQLKKDHTTILYHIKRYNQRTNVDNKGKILA